MAAATFRSETTLVLDNDEVYAIRELIGNTCERLWLEQAHLTSAQVDALGRVFRALRELPVQPCG